MNDKIRVLCLLQGTFKRFDQVVRQLSDKTDRICQKDLLFPRKFKLSGRRIERCEKLILLKNTRMGQVV